MKVTRITKFYRWGQLEASSFLQTHRLASTEVKNNFPAKKKEDQKALDAPLMKAIEGVPDLKSYLGARFSLKSGMKPHELVF
ncbi:unnamed protein product [Dovyalis caffra]|uniref:Uncharacterized protein n=1 Tax=Dovyalis caffra TaxID=77055 RepID=A0AAV1S2B5_9ROSI|nr:unnamed protein product [Dovyalis caffra]